MVHNNNDLIMARPLSSSFQLYGNNHGADTANAINSVSKREKKKKIETSNKKRATVGIIGGGIAGLSCAQHLQYAYDVTVYDTGRLRGGGRASSRQPHDPSKNDNDDNNIIDYPILSPFRFDHSAQFITSPASATTSSSSSSSWRKDFDIQVQQWVDQGILRVAPSNSIYTIAKKKKTKKLTWRCLNPVAKSLDVTKNNQNNEKVKSTSFKQKQEQQRFYYPHHGMSSLVRALTSGNAFKIKQDIWVSPSSGVRYQGPPPPLGCTSENQNDRTSSDNWNVRASGRTLGKHDHLIVAHNGKCADRLMSKTPAKDVHRLLRVNFNDRVPADGGGKMTLNSLYSLTLCLNGPSVLSQSFAKESESFIAGFIQDHPQLGLVTCQSNKYPPLTYRKDDDDNGDNNLEVWTIFSTAKFAKMHKAPQEFLPEDVIQKVTKLLVNSLQEDIIGDNDISDDITTALLENQIVESRLQLWGAAVPMNIWRGDSNSNIKRSTKDLDSSGFIYDPRYQVGVCGDWLMEPSIAGAWTSGRRLAQHLVDATSGNNASENSSTIESVGFKKGQFEASQSVKRLGIAALDGPIHSN